MGRSRSQVRATWLAWRNEASFRPWRSWWRRKEIRGISFIGSHPALNPFYPVVAMTSWLIFIIGSDDNVRDPAQPHPRRLRRPGDNGPAIKAQIDGPSNLAVDPRGNIYGYEFPGDIRRIDASTYKITTVVEECDRSERKPGTGGMLRIDRQSTDDRIRQPALGRIHPQSCLRV